MAAALLFIKILKIVAGLAIIISSIVIMRIWKRREGNLYAKRKAEKEVRDKNYILDKQIVTTNPINQNAEFDLIRTDKKMRIDEKLNEDMQKMLVISSMTLAITDILSMLCETGK